MFRSWAVVIASAVLIGLTGCGGGDDGASVRNIGEACPTSKTATGSGSATGASGSATGASGSATGATGSATGATGSASGTEC